MLAHALLAFLFLQLPQNDTSPQRVPCHTKLVQIAVFGEFYFDWLHSGFYNDSKDRLQSEMKITKGLGLLKSIVQNLLQRLIILAACQSMLKLILNKKMTIH